MKVVEMHVETQDLASLRGIHQFVSPYFHIKTLHERSICHGGSTDIYCCLQ